MILIAMLLQLASTPATAELPIDEDIVVTGKTTAEAKRLLDACMASHCRPDKEIKAALVYATRQMLDGDYPAARETLLVARRRNAAFDKTYPIAVSDLHRGLNRLSNLDGRQDSARISAVDATDALRAGLRPDDPTILQQRLFSGVQLAREGRIIGASDIYDDVAAQAHRKGWYAVEAQALFHGAVLYATLAGLDPRYQHSARRWAERITGRNEPEFVAMRDGLTALATATAAAAAKPQDRAAIYAAVKPIDRDEAVLLIEPALQIVADDPALASQHPANGTPEWADVGFWVRPDGSVGDMAILRRSDSEPGQWLSYKMQAVGKRRYAPFRGAATDKGLYRVERYSIVHNFRPTTGTRQPVRDAIGTIDTMDMTPLYRSPAI